MDMSNSTTMTQLLSDSKYLWNNSEHNHCNICLVSHVVKLINIKGNFAVYKDLHVNIEFVTKKFFFTRTKNKNAVKPYSSRAYCLFYACSGNDFVWDGDRATCRVRVHVYM